MPRSRRGALLFAVLIAGCSGSGIKAYRDAGAANVSIRTDVSGVRAALHVHDVAPDCRTEYRGTVALDAGPTAVAIPADRWSYLVFTFSSSSMLRGSSSSLRVGTLLKPRAGYGYDVRVSYRNAIYDVTMRETEAGKSSSRELPRRPLATCRS